MNAGALKKAMLFCGIALEICEFFPSKTNKQLRADVHYRFAAASNETNDAQACLKHTKVLLSLRLRASERSGIKDLRLAVAHNEIGIAWVMNGQRERGLAAFLESISIFEGLDDFIIAMDTNPRNNIAFTHWLMGNLEKASDAFEELLRDRITRFGPDDMESYRLVHNRVLSTK